LEEAVKSGRLAVAGYYAAPHYEVEESGPILVSDPGRHFKELWEMWDEQGRAEGDRAWVGDRVRYTIEPFSGDAARIKSKWQGYDRFGDKRSECLVVDYRWLAELTRCRPTRKRFWMVLST
jgi:hypothetical protein